MLNKTKRNKMRKNRKLRLSIKMKKENKEKKRKKTYSLKRNLIKIETSLLKTKNQMKR